ncbi:hypothetical protein KKD70_03940, partial [Patescibacteria group bacterium]|nr:hypothetical protein [Patescibacteria group bacterium]
MSKAKRKKKIAKKTSAKKNFSQQNKIIAKQKQQIVPAKTTPKKETVVTKKTTANSKLSEKAELKFLRETENYLKKAKIAEKHRKTRKNAVKKVSFVKKHLFAFDTKALSIIAFFILIFGAFSIQAVLSRNSGIQNLQTNIAGATRSSAMEAFEISQDYNVIAIDNGSYYVHPGETDAKIFAFAVDNKKTGLIMKELRLSKLGELEDSDFVKAKLYEGENIISEATIHNSEFYFREFTSSIQEGTYKEYTVKVDMNPELMAGARFR